MAINNTTPATPEQNTVTRPYRDRCAALQGDANSWRAHWSELCEFFFPRRGRFLNSNSERSNWGVKKNQKTINSIAFEAADTQAALWQGGLCPRTMPWVAFEVSDRNISEIPEVKKWLTDVRDIILSALEGSNFYNASFSVLKEFGVIGVGAMLIEKDYDRMIRFRAFTVGEYFIDVDEQGRPDTLYRRFAMKARQIIKKFGEDNVSDAVKTAFKNNTLDDFIIIHAIQPNDDFNPTKRSNQNLRWTDCYFEENGDQNKFLYKGGFRTRPFTAPRFDTAGNDAYGDSPGIRTLGDVKMLQKMEEKKLNALDKEVNPPVNIPTSMKGKGASLVPGGANFVDMAAGQTGVKPVMEVRPELRNMGLELDRVEKRINHGMYVDLLELILNDTTRRTATEIIQRNTDRLQKLMPAVGRLLTEFLTPVLNRVYDILDNEFGVIPVMPPQLIGQSIKVNYTSQLGVAMKIMQRVRPTQEFLSIVAGIAQLDPRALKKINGMELVDIAADALGVPPAGVYSDEEVQQMIAAEQAALAQQQQAQAAMNTVDAAQKMGNTPMGTNSVLDKFVEGQQV